MIKIRIALGNPYNFYSKIINIVKMKGGGHMQKYKGIFISHNESMNPNRN